MGYYINSTKNGPLSAKGKAAALIAHEGAKIVENPRFTPEVGLVCVVSNGPFEAAAFAYDEVEFDDFNYPADDRPKQWLVMDLARAKELAGYK